MEPLVESDLDPSLKSREYLLKRMLIIFFLMTKVVIAHYEMLENTAGLNDNR